MKALPLAGLFAFLERTLLSRMRNSQWSFGKEMLIDQLGTTSM